MEPLEKLILLRQVAALKRRRFVQLRALGIPRSTYYEWWRRYRRAGINGLAEMGNRGKASWNRLSPDERARVVAVAKAHPELSCRLLAIKITDEEAFSISEVFEQALGHAQALDHLQDGQKPLFLSDPGPGFTSQILADYLDYHGIRHIFGQP